MDSDSVGATPIREVTCPRCGRRTDRVQAFEVPVVVFLLVYIVWTHERVAGCPECVRARLWRLFLLSIPMANVFFPIVGALIQGDIRESHRTDEPGIPPEFHGWARLSPHTEAKPDSARGRVVRLLVALVIIGIAVAVVFVVLPRLTR